MTRNAKKAVRDLLVVLAGTILVALATRATDFGIPSEFAPIVATTALVIYRMLREQFDFLAEVDKVG